MISLILLIYWATVLMLLHTAHLNSRHAHLVLTGAGILRVVVRSRSTIREVIASG